MHLGRRLGNPLGKHCPGFLPTAPPGTPFLDIRPIEASNQIDTVSIYVNVDRYELLTHLFVDGQYSQTKGVDFSPVKTIVHFDVEDVAGGFIFSAVLFRRDDPLDVLAFTDIQLTGAGPVEQSSLGSNQTITPLAGNWYRVSMNIDAPIHDQYKLGFSISGGTTRVGAPQLTVNENGALRVGLTDDLSQWSDPLTPNGFTATGPVAYDINDGDFTFFDLWVFILEFEEQLLGVERHVFAAAFGGPFQSSEGPEIPTRGILPCTDNTRVHLQWPPTPAGSVQAIVIEASVDGGAWQPIDEVDPDRTQYVTSELPQGVYRFRIRGRDTSGNQSPVSSIADFNPPVWFDIFNPATVFIDTLGLTQVLVDNDPVALITNSGSLPGAQLLQPNVPDQPSFDANAIGHGAGVRVMGAQSHMEGGPANAWIGAGQEFDIFTAVVLEEQVPATDPPDDPNTTAFTKVIQFQGFFEIIATKFSDTFFDAPDDDFNSGVALVARMQTAGGPVNIPLPTTLYTTIPIRATYDGNDLIFQVGSEVASEPAVNPDPPVNIDVWGEAGPAGLEAVVGPLVVYPQPFPQGDELLAVIEDKSSCPTTFIIGEIIQAPNGINISFAGANGAITGNPSTTPSVTEYRLYTNNGTEEFPDFTTPVDVQPTPSFILPMTEGFWRIVVRASDGVSEDGNFENRLDIDVVEKTPGLLELKGPEPNTLQQLEVTTAPGGSITISGSYRAWQEQAVGVSFDVWIFEEGTPIDLSDPLDASLAIPFHEQGADLTFELIPTTIGPFSEVPHVLVGRVRSSDGDYNVTGELRASFTPISSLPLEPLGLKGNTC